MIHPILNRDETVLLADTDEQRLRLIAESLSAAGVRAVPALGGGELLEAIRGQLFSRAVVAADMTAAGQPALWRLASLPSMRRLVAVGPLDCETDARRNGADVFLCHPPRLDDLLRALRSAWNVVERV